MLPWREYVSLAILIVLSCYQSAYLPRSFWRLYLRQLLHKDPHLVFSLGILQRCFMILRQGGKFLSNLC